MNSQDLLFSIVTPSFNQAQYLERTLRSVLDQNYPRIEYLVLDGGSTDGSPEIIRRHETRLAYWTSAPDAGQAAAINSGWRRARGDVLAWINSDDYYLPGALSTVAEELQRRPSALMVYGQCLVVDQDGRSLGKMGGPFDLTRLLLVGNMISQPATFIRRQALELAGPLDENLRYAMDYDFFIRVARLASPVFVEVPLASYTMHPLAKTVHDRARARAETYAVAGRYATRRQHVAVGALALRSRLYHRLPKGALKALDRLRGLPSAGPYPR